MKKNIFLFLFTLYTVSGFSQLLDKNSIGALTTNNRYFGSARFEAMSGAFGALGAIPSAVSINPAGAAIALSNPVSFSLGLKRNSTQSSYYGTNTNSDHDSFNLNQLGAILLFDNIDNDQWSKIALSLNYQLKSDFYNEYSIKGNNGYSYFNSHPSKDTEFNNAIKQQFINITKGNSGVFNIGLASVHNKKLHIGAAVNIHSFRFEQTTILEETNRDTNNNTLEAYNKQNNIYESSGLSLSLGLIYKIEKSLRLGIAYETATWYSEVIEDTNVFDDNLGLVELKASNIEDIYVENETIGKYAYSLITPGKLTLSTSYIFGKRGLISFDYSCKDYSNIKFSDGNFIDINNGFKQNLKNTNTFNIGTEWRFKKLSVRGGYHYEDIPFSGAKNSDNLKGFSTGLGYNFGKFIIDIAYRKDNNTSFYNIYPAEHQTNSAELDINTSRITGSLTFKL